MVQSSVDLGAADLVSTTSGLVLHISTLAQFTPSSTNGNDPNDRLTIQRILSDTRPWIQRGKNFRFVLSLRVPSVIGVQEKSQFLEKLAASLKEAELWQQLHLRPLSVESYRDDGEALDLITTCLAYLDVEDKQMQSRRLHKLGLDIPFHDVKPPAAVMTYNLDEINLTLDITSHKGIKRRGPDSSSDPSLVRNEAHRPIADSYWSDEELIGPEVGEAAISEDRDVRYHDLNDPPLSECENCGTEWYEMNFPMWDPYSINLQAQHGGNLPFQELCLSGVDLESTTQNSALTGSMLQLVDSAMRLSIHKGARLSKGVKAKNCEQLHHLSAIVPSLWSPGYLNNISNRAVFIPTIAHALKNVCGSEFRTNGFKSKPERSNLPVTDTKEQMESLTSSLWMLLQRQVANANAGRRLKPLFETQNPATAGIEDIREMPDASHAWLVSDGSSPNNLLLDEMDYGPRYYEGHPTFEDDSFDASSTFGRDDENYVVEDVQSPDHDLDHPTTSGRLKQLLDRCERHQPAPSHESERLFASLLHGCCLPAAGGNAEEGGEGLLSACDRTESPNASEEDHMMLDS